MHQSGCSRSETRALQRWKGMVPRFTRKASVSTSSQTNWRMGPSSPSICTVRTQEGTWGPACFWKKLSAWMPSGKRVSISGRSRRYGSIQGAMAW